MCILNPRVDFAFKKLFGSEENTEITVSLLNAIIEPKIPITQVTLLNPYNAKDFASDKLSIRDIKARDERGDYYIIEMQLTDQDWFAQRALYYWARTYVGQLRERVNYDMLYRTVGINILNFNCLDEEKNYHNVYRLQNIESSKTFIDHQEIHFIELNKASEDLSTVKTALDRWVLFLKTASDYIGEEIPSEMSDLDGICKAFDVLEKMSLSSSERELYEASLKWFRDEEAALKTAERKGIDKGIELGMAQGIEQGIEQGIVQGIDKGMEKAKRELVKQMSLNGLDYVEISKLTKLTIDEIRKLLDV